MMENAASSDIESKTQSYWQLSSKWNGRIDAKVSCGTALRITNTLITSLQPQMALRGAVSKIADDIIRNKRTKKSKKPPTNMVTMEQLRKQHEALQKKRAERAAKAALKTKTG